MIYDIVITHTLVLYVCVCTHERVHTRMIISLDLDLTNKATDILICMYLTTYIVGNVLLIRVILIHVN